MNKWPMDLEVFLLAKPIIKNAEGFVSKPYLCPAKKWSIGWGSTKYADGRPVTPIDVPIDQAFAEVLLTAAMSRVYRDLQKGDMITRVPNVHQAAAFVSLAYNVGVGAHDGVKGDLADSTLFAKFNAGEIENAANEFPKWSKAHIGGVLTELPGLVSRRLAERQLFLA